MRHATLALLIFTLILPLNADACTPVHRSQAVKRQFRTTHPCPATGLTSGPCVGWVLDHIDPLCHTGPAGDTPANLQWQDVQSAKIKDAQERQMCRAHPRPCPHQGD